MQSIQISRYVPNQEITVGKVLRTAFYVHLLILFFQLPLRELTIDSTFWRDIGVTFIAIVWLLAVIAKVASGTVRLSSLGTFIFLYICYGLIIFVINVLTRSSFLDSVYYFRNHFLPFFMYFPAKYAFSDSAHQKRFINFTFIIFVIYAIAPILEVILRDTGFALSSIPWYRFSFNQGDRFEASGGYIAPDDSPILGLLGFPHYTFVPIVCIFALMYHFLLPTTDTRQNLSKDSFELTSIPFMRYVYIALLIGTVSILGVRTHIISTLLILFLFAPNRPHKGRYLIVTVLSIFVVYILLSLITGTSVIDSYSQFVGGFTNDAGNSSLAAILSFNDFLFVMNSPLVNLLVGNGFEVISATTFESIANSTGWEIKLLFYTAVYGFAWLLLLTQIFITAYRYANACVNKFEQNSFQSLYAKGFKIMLIVLFIDAGHYMRMMTWPVLDFFIICLAILAAIHAKRKEYSLCSR
jgi:hypothetical protein